MSNAVLINGKRNVYDLWVIAPDGTEGEQAWGLADRMDAAAFARSLTLPDGFAFDIRNRWETVR